MSYTRVLPRDLFNEASLLKCYGRLWLLIEGHPIAQFDEEDVPAFDIAMDESDGSLTIRNLTLRVSLAPRRLKRPLNSRQPWPLWIESDSGGDDIPVFDGEGNLSPEMRALIAP